MNKVVVGVVAGAVLGFIDGASAWFTPEVRSMMTSILVGSTFKGLLVGLLCGLIARKVHSIKAGLIAGAVLGLIFAYAVAAMPSENGKHYYLEIMLPGFVVGAITGFLTQRYGNTPARAN